MRERIVIKRISPRFHVITTTLIIVFVLLCLKYSTQINLWGDEAFSLFCAELDWSDILVADPIHTPTYYLLLKLVTMIVGTQQELLLRIIHTIPFIAGLLVGSWTLMRVFNNRRNVLLTLAISIWLPNYIFYATNIRMYSLLFMFAMVFIAAIAISLQNEDNLSSLQLLGLGLGSLGLLLSDYSGIIYYLPGLGYLLVQAYRQRYYKSLIVAVSPAVLLLLFIILFSPESIQSILNWPVVESRGIGNIFSGGITAIAKTIYLSLRPGLDLVYVAGLPTVFAIAFPIIFLLFYAFIAIKIWPTSQNSIQTQWLLLISIIWLFAAPTGYSFTRLFLPSQFFTIALVVHVASLLNKLYQKIICWLLIGIMLALNFNEAINPTLRFYNLIPYGQISADVLKAIDNYEASTIILSGNSLNTMSIERYLRQQLKGNEMGKEIKIIRLKPNSKILSNATSFSSLIFVSHMEENGEFIDVNMLKQQLNKDAKEIGGYVELVGLPYNPVWKQRIIDRTNQSHAIKTYVLNNNI